MDANTSTETATALPAAEVERGRLYLRQTTDYAIGATQGLSDAQWRFKPAPDRWSIAEIVEHIVTVQELVLGPLRQQLASAPPSGEHDYERVDRMVVTQIPNRLEKYPSPATVQPAGQWPPDVASVRLLANFARLTEYLESTPDLREHSLAAAPLKAVSKGEFEFMDGYQWILATAAHTERHTKQILEVRAQANFPIPW